MTRSVHFIAAYLLLVLGFWLVPFMITGWKGRGWAGFPRIVSFQHSAAGLFTHAVPVWREYHLEGQRSDGTRFELDERKIFPMGAFGFRSRYDRIMSETQRMPRVEELRLRIADHVAWRWQHLGGEAVRGGVKGPAGKSLEKGGGEVDAVGSLDGEADLTGLRLVMTLWKTGSADMAEPAGEWKQPEVTEVTGHQRVVLGGYAIRNGTARGGASVVKEVTAPEAAPGGVPQEETVPGAKRLLMHPGPPPKRELVQPSAMVDPPGDVKEADGDELKPGVDPRSEGGL